MKTIEFSHLEKEMANFDFKELAAKTSESKSNIEKAASVADIKNEICNVWSKIRKYVILA